MKTITTITISTICALASHADSSDAYDLRYNPDNGSLTIVTKGNIISYVLESSQSFGIGRFTPENHRLFVSIEEVAPGFFYQTGPAISSSVQLFDAMNISTYQAGYTIPPGSYNIGNVLQKDLTEEQYLNLFDKANDYIVVAGTGSAKKFNLVYAPEPTSLAMLSAAGLTLVRRRRP